MEVEPSLSGSPTWSGLGLTVGGEGLLLSGLDDWFPKKEKHFLKTCFYLRYQNRVTLFENHSKMSHFSISERCTQVYLLIRTTCCPCTAFFSGHVWLLIFTNKYTLHSWKSLKKSQFTTLRDRTLRGRTLRGRTLRGRTLRGRALQGRTLRGRTLQGRALRGGFQFWFQETNWSKVSVLTETKKVVFLVH